MWQLFRESDCFCLCYLLFLCIVFNVINIVIVCSYFYTCSSSSRLLFFHGYPLIKVDCLLVWCSWWCKLLLLLYIIWFLLLYIIWLLLLYINCLLLLFWWLLLIKLLSCLKWCKRIKLIRNIQWWGVSSR